MLRSNKSIQTTIFNAFSLKHTHHWRPNSNKFSLPDSTPVHPFYEKSPPTHPRYNAPSSPKKNRISPAVDPIGHASPPHYPLPSSWSTSKRNIASVPFKNSIVHPEGVARFPSRSGRRSGGCGGIPHHPYCCSTPREGCTPGQVALCVFRRGRGRGEARTGARGRVKCIMWNGEWIGSAREGEESFDQAPLCAGKLGPFSFFFFKRDGKRDAAHFYSWTEIADTRGGNECTTILFFSRVERFRFNFFFFPRWKWTLISIDLGL